MLLIIVIYPLVEPTKLIMTAGVGSYEWHEFFPYLKYNLGVVITIWAPIVVVYFRDTQIWYAIFAIIFGGIQGAFSHLGEIRTLGMLRSRFESVPSAFSEHLVPGSEVESSRNQAKILKELTQLVATYGEETPDLRLQAMKERGDLRLVVKFDRHPNSTILNHTNHHCISRCLALMESLQRCSMNQTSYNNSCLRTEESST